MGPFELIQPANLREALASLAAADEGVKVLAGGTALVRFMQAHEVNPRRLVALHRLKAELGGIRAASDGLHIGALATLTDLERHSLTAAHLPVVVRALKILATPRIRNAATLGGHLAQAEPQTDLPTILHCLGARVRVQSQAAERWLAIPELFVATHRNSLAPGELLTEIVVPAQRQCAAYAKCTTISQSHDWPALGVAVQFDLDAGHIRDCHVVLGAAVPHPIRLPEVEAVLEGQAPSPALFARAAEQATHGVAPFSDIRASAAYKRAVIPVYVRRALAAAVEGS
ncbi:hypothetical protein AYO44_12025 [Planctomycetaceae bacterium SCGC AG-212-F19]|nr:hypothetical protein AYO44_12025 [Planctomycetaceae bacterium SCGC AG-212-F19]